MPGYATPITLADGKERTLRYDFAALILIEERLGISIDQLEDKLAGQGRKLSVVRDLLWAGLAHEDKTLTPDAVAALVDMRHLSDVADAIARALLASVGGDGEPKNADKPA